jgi:two-component system sensor histidine kinase DctS
VWLCVPIFDRGEFLGSYVAVFSLSKTLELIVPAWFRKTHKLEVLDPGAEIQLDGNDPHRISKEQRFLASLDMPGSDTYLQIYAIDAPHATVPRALLGVALAFLVGMVASLVFLRRDIEKRQAVEDSLAAQVALRRSMEDSIDVGLFARDLAGVILYANRAFCDMVGCRDDALLGTTESLPGWPEPDHGLEEAEIEFRRGDGKVVTLLIHVVPLVHANGRQIGWMNSVLDISDRRKAEKAAQVQQQRLESAGRLVAIGEVASTLAHELNQPLGALSSFANGLLNRMRKGNIEPLQVESIVERINALAEKTGGIIRRVNAFARRREMHKENLDLAEFLRARYPTGVIAPGVRLELGLPSAPVFVKADVVLFEQALRNVVQNAAEAAVAASAAPLVRVDLALSSDGTEASISVSDNGAGIDDDTRSRIFDAFYSSKQEGMGMGLAICRSILEAHHGRIELLEDAARQGACFRLWIPMNE